MAADKDMLIEVRATDEGSAEVVRDNTKAIQQLDDAAESTSTGMQRVSQGQRNMRLSGRRANLVLMDTGRIIQDLPYGMMGVANNIDPFVNQMQIAREEAGSWGQVLSGLGASLTGPAGIALAVSTVTSVLISFGPQIADFFGIFEDGKNKIDDAAGSLESFFGQQASLLLDELSQIEAFDPQGPFDPVLLDQQIRLISETLADLPDDFTDAQEQRLRELRNRLGQFGLTEEESAELAQLELQQAQAAQFAEDRADLQEKENELIEERMLMARAANTEQGQRIQRLYEEQQRQEELEKIEERRANAMAELAEARQDAIQMDRPEDEIIQAGELDLALGGGQVPLSEMAGATENQRQALMRYNEELARANDLTVEHADRMLYQYQSAEQLNTMVNQLTTAGFQQMGVILGDIMSTDFEGGVFQRFQLVFSDFLSRFGDQMIALGTAKLGLDNLFKAGPAGALMAIAGGVALKAAAQATRNDAQKRLSNLSGGTGSTGNVLAGYRGFDVSGTQTEGQGRGDRTRGRDSAFLGTLRITNGFGDMVLEGQAEIDRSGGSNYLRGD